MPNMNPNKMPMPEQAPDVRNKNFEEVTLGYTPEMAVEEAQRCLNCKNKPCISGCRYKSRFRNSSRWLLRASSSRLLRRSRRPPRCRLSAAVYARRKPSASRSACAASRRAVAIGRLERFVADYAREHGEEKAVKPASNGHKCAIVGAGPAGLTCAGDLARMGYEVTVFEALHTAGGVLMYGIPEFRLPKEIVQKEIDTLKDLGVEFVLNFVVGRSETIDELFADGYEAVFVGSGAGLPTFMGVPGENANGVYSANEYLTRINLMKAYKDDAPTPIFHAHKVAVVGGGNVAMDAARCAKRMGAEEVYIVYRRSEKELPARLEEIHHAKEEGIIFKFLTAPLEVLSDENYNVTGLKCQQMELGEPDESGRRRPVPVEGSEFTIDLDCVIAAIGTSPNPLIRHTTPGLDTNRKGCIIADDEHGITSKDGVFRRRRRCDRRGYRYPCHGRGQARCRGDG